ncbi:intradiol ring-cleavage dioxygenase [Streptomyces sp. NBC_01506]|uniref:intradiol ring-cleavage dioxygenase n=1 Tax=Streptomyces sp. NBC_01506 TaxID=2903887 RepID=UPI003868A0C7
MSETPPNDKKPQPHSRRSLLVTLGGAGLGVAAAGSAAVGADARPAAAATPSGTTVKPSCVLSPEEMTGPYYLDIDKVRHTIAEDRTGVPLELTFMIVDSVSCRPVRNVAVDIWHCDAGGLYSGYTGYSGPGLPPTDENGHATPTDDTTFLRGVQVTDRLGLVRFRTVYPGWYWGRGLHIHLKTIVDASVRPDSVTGGHVAHTGQLYFPQSVNDKVAAVPPYSSNTTPRLSNAEDFFYSMDNKGPESTMVVTPLKGNGSIKHGLRASIVLGIDPGATPPPANPTPPPTSAPTPPPTA